MVGKGTIGGLLLAAVAAGGGLSACAPATGGASSRSAAANPITSGPQIGRCDRSGCSWFEIQSFEMVRETEHGALLRIKLRDGESDSGSGPHPTSSRGVKIEWTGEVSDQYVFCSTKLPAIITGGEGSYEAQRLDLIQWGNPSEYNMKVYSHVCHNGEDILAQGKAARAGYRSIEGQEPNIALTRPEAIFDHIRP